jgi:hypothetical protein
MTKVIPLEASQDIIETYFNNPNVKLIGLKVDQSSLVGEIYHLHNTEMLQRTEIPDEEGLTLYYQKLYPKGTIIDNGKTSQPTTLEQDEIVIIPWFIPAKNLNRLLQFALETINYSTELTDFT